MRKNAEEYFSVGEFAKLFNLSKQTLFYYERNKIFQPAFIDQNGYRYYALEQYFVFEIIATLRKLGLPLQKIAAYVKRRDIDALQRIFAEKQKECDRQIEIATRNRRNLQVKIDRLEQVKKIRVDKITLENAPEEYLIVDKFLHLDASMKEKIKLVARHNFPFSTSQVLNEYLMGYILDRQDVLRQDFSNISRLFTKVSHPEEYRNVAVKPAGLYATIFTPKGYHVNYKKALKKLFDFIELNRLQVVGHAYITQLRNYWSTDNPDGYITQIAIHVDYAEEPEADGPQALTGCENSGCS